MPEENGLFEKLKSWPDMGIRSEGLVIMVVTEGDILGKVFTR